MKRKQKSLWCFLDGKKHCDVIEWALAANVMKDEAKSLLIVQYPGMEVTFKII